MKLAGIKINKRYPDFEDEAEFVCYIIIEDNGQFLRYVDLEFEIDPESELWTDADTYKSHVLDIVLPKFGLTKLPPDVPCKYEDCTVYPDIRSGFPTTEVILYDLELVKE